jgi:hypothetical protein
MPSWRFAERFHREPMKLSSRKARVPRHYPDSPRSLRRVQAAPDPANRASIPKNPKRP